MEGDVVVVGGGIVGSSIARDAALRGLSVALLERRDFGAGTSSKTSRMLHGGVRYLRQGRLGLVRQALRERNLLRDLEPGLVLPTDFAVPVYEGSGLGPALTRLGLRIYRGFARDRGGDWLKPARADEAAPGLERKGLRGIGGYRDVLVRDARLVLEVARSAARSGAAVLNHAQVNSFVHEGGKITALAVADVFTLADDVVVRGTTFVNASGPWVDAIRRLDDPAAEPLLRPTKGVHLLVARGRIDHKRAVVLEMRDGRIVFVLPWGKFTIVGTTDTDYKGSLDDVAATPDDVSYLLAAINEFFPAANLGVADVVSTYAGVRPLVSHGESRGSASDVSRSHEVIESASGLWTIAGGKLTTARAMAEDVVDRIVRRLGRGGACRTRREPLRHESLEPATYAARLAGLGLSADAIPHLASTYLSEEIVPILEEDAAYRAPLVGGLPYVVGEVVQAARHEMACEVDDVLARRTAILLEAPDNGEACAEAVSAILLREASVLSKPENYREIARRARAR